MTDFKCQLKSFLFLSFGLLFSFITTPSYAIEASDEFEIQYSPPFLSDGMPISLKGKWKVWTLVGEPAKELHVVWKNNDFVIMGGEYYGPGRDECYSVPQSVLNEVSLINLKLKAKVAGGYQQQGLGYYMLFDAGSMKKATGPNTYGEKNFTVPGIKNWDELFIVDDLSKRFASEDTARRIIKAGLKLGTPEVYSVGFNLGPVRDWVRSCEREKEKAKKALEKKLAEQAKADQQNDFDQKLRQLAKDESQNTDDSDSSKNQEERSFEDQLAALPAQWAEQERLEKEKLAKENAEREEQKRVEGEIEKARLAKQATEKFNCNNPANTPKKTYLYSDEYFKSINNVSLKYREWDDRYSQQYAIPYINSVEANRTFSNKGVTYPLVKLSLDVSNKDPNSPLCIVLAIHREEYRSEYIVDGNLLNWVAEVEIESMYTNGDWRIMNGYFLSGSLKKSKEANKFNEYFYIDLRPCSTSKNKNSLAYQTHCE